MSGTISFGGIGSNIDVDGIVKALVGANKGTLNAINSRITSTKSAATNISTISSLFAKIGTAARALDDANETRGNTATSSSDAISPSAIGTAVAGTYGVKVLGLAQEARVYGNTYSSTTSALGHEGTLGLSLGGKSATLAITAQDSLNSIVDKINGAGLRVSATTVYDGTHHRLVLNGLDKGSDNTLSIDQQGFDLGLELEVNIKQRASNAKVEIDGILVESQSNQIVGAIPGVTLAVTKTTDTAATLTVASDPDSVGTKLKSVVDAYNAVINKIHDVAGFGSTAATDAALAGDSTLRGLTSRMASVVATQVSTGTDHSNLASIGISLTRDGTLSFDSSKFKSAMTTDPAGVSQLLAGSGTGDGIMDIFRNLSADTTASNTGVLSTKHNTLNAQAKSLQDRASREQARLDTYEQRLLSQFSAIEGTVSQSTNDISYLQSYSIGSSK